MITIIRSRGDLYAILGQPEKVKIDLQQAAILFRQQENMATYEKVMQFLQQLWGWNRNHQLWKVEKLSKNWRMRDGIK